jgi:hypothetical protein
MNELNRFSTYAVIAVVVTLPLLSKIKMKTATAQSTTSVQSSTPAAKPNSAGKPRLLKLELSISQPKD